MSIKGFSTDNGIQRYDYNYLDNKPNNIGIFWAVYGETTSDEIATAISKILFELYDYLAVWILAFAPCLHSWVILECAVDYFALIWIHWFECD